MMLYARAARLCGGAEDPPVVSFQITADLPVVRQFQKLIGLHQYQGSAQGRRQRPRSLPRRASAAILSVLLTCSTRSSSVPRSFPGSQPHTRRDRTERREYESRLVREPPAGKWRMLIDAATRSFACSRSASSSASVLLPLMPQSGHCILDREKPRPFPDAHDARVNTLRAEFLRLHGVFQGPARSL